MFETLRWIVCGLSGLLLGFIACCNVVFAVGTARGDASLPPPMPVLALTACLVTVLACPARPRWFVPAVIAVTVVAVLAAQLGRALDRRRR